MTDSKPTPIDQILFVAVLIFFCVGYYIVPWNYGYTRHYIYSAFLIVAILAHSSDRGRPFATSLEAIALLAISRSILESAFFQLGLFANFGAVARLGMWSLIALLLLGFLVLVKGQRLKDLYWAKAAPGTLKKFLPLAIVLLLLIFPVFHWFKGLEFNPQSGLVPNGGWPIIIAAGIGFAFINAGFEEVIFRGVFLTQFLRCCGYPVALVLQAILFGASHYLAGFPSGAFGFVITFVLALALGHLMIRTKSIYVPWAVHFVADVVVYVLTLGRIKGWW